MKHPTTLAYAAAVVAAALRCLAQQTDLAPLAPEEPTVAAPAPEAAVPTVRDPFWPVGYWPQPKVDDSPTVATEEPVAPEPTVVEQWPKLNLKGITQKANGVCIAFLEGIGVIEAGSVVTLQKDGLIYRWRITTVSPNGVGHVRLDARPVPRR